MIEAAIFSVLQMVLVVAFAIFVVVVPLRILAVLKKILYILESERTGTPHNPRDD